ncbi:MAG TPA: ABC transporter permease, partial [Flavihumibacter sp.]|nr:ABC transporter permease [Flavihumibacter sp.]
LANVFTRDKAKGIGLAIMGWLYFALLFDAIVLFLFFQFADYPIEKVVVLLSALSPIDLCRINILLHLDVSAMMGYTGAIFRDYFGAGGLILSSTLLLLWAFVPFYISLIRFKNKDL